MRSAFILTLLSCGAAYGQDDPPVPGKAEDLVEKAAEKVAEALDVEQVMPDFERAVEFLVTTQLETGQWGTGSPECLLELGFAHDTYASWQLAGHGLACMALARANETPERRESLERAVSWLCEAKIPKRPSDWDIDNVWSALYGFVATVDLAQDPRFAQDPWKRKIAERGTEFYEMLVRYQALSGGWAYYDDPPFMPTPTWATSFCTALVLPSLLEARGLGWEIDDELIARANKYVKRCALPGGAYAYDLTPVPRISGVEHINLVQGSLGRTQVCNWALVRTGEKSVTHDVIREGLEDFFRYRKFLDHVRTRPIPHEGFYANAGYFYFFGHYYAARAISLLPAEERESWHARLRPHLVKTQFESGGTSDFLDSSYMVTASTSFLVLSLAEGLPAADAR